MALRTARAASLLLRVGSSTTQSSRGALRPPTNLPYRGIYRTDGETVRRDELLVCQVRFNYHPGLNVYSENDRGQILLKSDVDGVVKISREKVEPNFDLPEMQTYEYKKTVDLYKLTFNVVPLEMSKTYNLVNTV